MGPFALSFLVLLLARANADFKDENGVLVLTDADFSDALEQYENVMVMFHAPWCGHCRAFKPAYEEAAKRLKDNSKIAITKVDATENKEVSQKFQITGYPTIKLFRNKEPIDFNAGRDADSVVSWILRKLEPPITNLNTVEEAKAFIDSANVTLVAFTKSENSDLTAVLRKLGDSDKASIGLSSSPEVLSKYGIDSSVKVILFRKFDEPRVEFDGDLTTDALEKFIITETIPLVVDFNPQQASEVFSSPIKRHVVYFAKKPDSYDKSKELLLPIAKKFKGKVHVILIDISDPEHGRVLEFFGLTEADVPIYRIIDIEDDMAKYKPETNDLSEDAITAFIDSIISGATKPYLMSQEIPPESDDPVKILVGKNYNEFVRDNSKAVFAFLHAPWCGHCKQLSPTWDELGKAFHNREGIAIVKMDATANEAEGLKVHSFPTLKYYGKDSDEVIEYTGERSLEALKQFVESGGKAAGEGKSSEGEDKEEAEKHERDEL